MMLIMTRPNKYLILSITRIKRLFSVIKDLAMEHLETKKCLIGLFLKWIQYSLGVVLVINGPNTNTKVKNKKLRYMHLKRQRKRKIIKC